MNENDIFDNEIIKEKKKIEFKSKFKWMLFHSLIMFYSFFIEISKKSDFFLFPKVWKINNAWQILSSVVLIEIGNE